MSHLDSLVVLVTETSKPAVEWLHSQTGDPLFNVSVVVSKEKANFCLSLIKLQQF